MLSEHVRCDQGCPYDAVHGTTRCLQHWDPTQRAAPIVAPLHLDPKVDVADIWDLACAETHQVMPPARPYLKPAATVGFDEPAPRNWLARALERIMR